MSDVSIDIKPADPVGTENVHPSPFQVAVKLKAPSSGHFIGTLPLWGKVPTKFLVGPGNAATGQAVVARLHKVLSAEHSIYKYEAWGQNITTNTLLLTAVDQDPISPILHPDWYTLSASVDRPEDFFSKLNVVVGPERLNLVQKDELDTTAAGHELNAIFMSPTYVVRIKLPLFFRTPLARMEVVLQRRDLTTSSAGTNLTITFMQGLVCSSTGEQSATVVLCPFTGTIEAANIWVCPTISAARADPETRAALKNDRDYNGLPMTWQSSFLGSMVVNSTGQESHDLSPRDYPNAPGADQSFGVSSTSLLWGPFAQPDNLWQLMTSADKLLRQPSHWFEPNSYLPVSTAAGAHPQLTMHKMHPWTNESQVRYMDGLGVFKQYESANPTPDGIWNYDHEHRSICPLATAFVLTGDLKYQISLRFRAHAEFYERSVINGWVQNGRGAGRPLATMALMAAADSYCWVLLKDNALKRVKQVLDRQVQRWPDITKPVIVATTFAQNGQELFTGYEEGLLAQAALLTYIQWSFPEALRLAWISGRTCLSTIRYIGNEWTTGYQVPIVSDGSPCPDSAIVPPGPWLRRWSAAGAKAFYLADVYYTIVGAEPPTLVDRDLWKKRASDCLIWFESSRFPDTSPVETTDYIHQTMYKTITIQPIA